MENVVLHGPRSMEDTVRWRITTFHHNWNRLYLKNPQKIKLNHTLFVPGKYIQIRIFIIAVSDKIKYQDEDRLPGDLISLNPSTNKTHL